MPARTTDTSRIGLTVLHTAALVYGYVASALTAIMLFYVISSAVGFGMPAIELPLPANDATLAPGLAVDPTTPDAHFTSVEFTAQGLSTAVNLIFYSPPVLMLIAHAVVAFSVAVLTGTVRSSTPFAPAATRAVVITGITIGVAGSLCQILTNVGTSLARAELLRDTDFYSGYVYTPTFDFSFLLIGAALVVIGSVFRLGQRLQRDTEGLV